MCGMSGSYHGEIPLPDSTAVAITFGAWSLHGVTAAFGAVERDVAVIPGDAAGETARELVAELFDSHHLFDRGTPT